jgi:5-methylcytosine-specific restriction endonuclease McrA
VYLRRNGTRRDGYEFDAATVEAVWRKGRIAAGYDPNRWRKDACNAWMDRTKYGDTSSGHGWEIDHVYPASKGGGDELNNLQPLQWSNNRSKSDDYPQWSCAV